MSHEVRTPLNGIMGLTSMLLQSAITPQQRQKLTFIEQSSNSLLCILNDILNFSALEKGQTGLNSQVFSVINVVKECVSQLSVSSASKDVPILTHVASELTTNDKISPVASEHKPTAMVVDDNDINRLVTETYLNKLNVNVASAANGKEAVELYRVTPCDIIMMDLQMPVMDGFEATRLIKALNPAVTIIAISASTEQDTINKAIEAGADDFIAKPATFDTIADRLTPYLCKR